MATRRTTQIDQALDRIEDGAVRQALSQIVDLVNDLVGRGLDTQGRVSTQRGFETNGGGACKWMIYKGSLEDTVTNPNNVAFLKAPGPILGWMAYTQRNGSEVWWPMPTNTSGTTNYVSLAEGLEDTIVITNGSNTYFNAYRAIIFYQDQTT